MLNQFSIYASYLRNIDGNKRNQEMHFRLVGRRYGDISTKTRNLNMLYNKTIVGIHPDLVDFTDVTTTQGPH